MTVTDALKAMATLEGQRDGSEARAAIVEALTERLLKDPEEFWDSFFETMSTLDPSPERVVAEKLLRSGVVNPETTTNGELRKILAADAANEVA